MGTSAVNEVASVGARYRQLRRLTCHTAEQAQELVDCEQRLLDWTVSSTTPADRRAGGRGRDALVALLEADQDALLRSLRSGGVGHSDAEDLVQATVLAVLRAYEKTPLKLDRGVVSLRRYVRRTVNSQIRVYRRQMSRE